MNKIFVILGKSSSGKDTIFRKLSLDNCLNKKVKSVILYTTRPIRDGEINKITYNFVSIDTFYKLKKANKIIEYRKYDTKCGLWYYFMVKDINFNFDNSYIVIGTLESYKSLVNYFGKDLVEHIYIESNTLKRLYRSYKRQKSNIVDKKRYFEIFRRLKFDNIDFSKNNLSKIGIYNKFKNNNLNKCFKLIKNYIINVINDN